MCTWFTIQRVQKGVKWKVSFSSLILPAIHCSFLEVLLLVCFVCLFYRFIYFFIYFWLRWVFVSARGLSLVAASGSHSSPQCVGPSLQWPLPLQSTGSRCAGPSSCGMQAQQLWPSGSRAQAQQLWHIGLAAPWHVESSQTRARTRVPCIGRRIPNHCAMREVPPVVVVFFFFLRDILYIYMVQGYVCAHVCICILKKCIYVYNFSLYF